MGKQYRLLFSVFIFAATAVVVFSIYPDLFVSSNSDNVFTKQYENPRARAELEFKQLRNPATGKIPKDIHKKEIEFAKNIPARKNYQLSKSSLTKTYDWESIGPRNVAGRTRALAFDIRNEDILLAGGVTGGVFKSIDGGESWYRVTAKSIRHTVTSIVQDTRPGKEDNWYYSAGEFQASASTEGAEYYGNGVYHSTDNGENWEVIESTYYGNVIYNNPFQITYRISIDPSNMEETELYVACKGAVMRSVDGGVTWSPAIGSGQGDISYFTDVEVTSNGIVYVGFSNYTTDGIYGADKYGMYSSDDGVAWTDITPLDLPYNTKRIVMDVYDADENVVFFLAETPEAGVSGHSIWRYEHSVVGGTWSNRSGAIPYDEDEESIYRFDSQESYDLVIAVKPDDENYVFIGGTSLFRSSDGFQSSENVTHIGGYANADWPVYNNHWVDQHVILFSNNDYNKMYCGNDGGIYKTDNCKSDAVEWNTLNKNYVTSQFYDIAIDEKTAGSEFVMGGLQDRGVWFSNSLSFNTDWEIVPIAGDGSYCEIVQGGEVYYCSYQLGGIARIIGDKTNHTEIRDSDEDEFLFVNPLVLDPNNQNVMYAAGLSGLHVNTNLMSESPSDYWKLVGLGRNNNMTALDVSTTPPDIVYCGFADGAVYRIEGAASDIISIQEITGFNLPDGYIIDVWVDPADADNVIIVFSNYGIPSVFVTDNGGINWYDISGNLEEFPDGSGNGPSFRTVDVLKVNGESIVFVGTSVGLFSATELNGQSTVWNYEGANTIGNVVVYSLETRSLDGSVFAATHGSGIYKSVITTDVGDDIVPRSISLSQNYPNPFNPSTTINYYLPKGTNVELKVYDVVGQEVAVLVNEFKSAGEHSADFNAPSLSSGAYVYRLIAGNYIENKKMLLLK